MSASSLLDERVAAERLGLSVHTLRKWRHAGRGPRFVKLPGAENRGRGGAGLVRYRPEDLEAFLEGASSHTPDPHREGTMIEAARPCFDLTTRVSIPVPLPSNERRLLIRDLDWRRIRRSLEDCTSPRPWMRVAYSTLFSIGGSALLSATQFAPVHATSLVLPVSWLIFGLCAIGGIVLALLDRFHHEQHCDDLSTVLREMDEIESTFSAKGTPN